MPTPASLVTPASIQWTVDAYLKRPPIIVRDLNALTTQRYVADRIFARGTPDQVAGGSAIFQRSESIFPDAGRDVEEVGVRSAYPRMTFSEDLFTAIVHQYGLEFPVSYLNIRRNARDNVTRGLIKLANAMVRYVDTKAMSLITTDTGVQTSNATAAWSGGTANIVKDIANARRLIEAAEQGYELDTMIVSLVEEQSLLSNATLLSLLPRETTSGQLTTGIAAPLLGLRQIIATPRLTTGTVLFMQSGVAGTIADEMPAPEEGFTTYDPGAGSDGRPVHVRIYDDVERSQRVVRGMRSPAMWLAEPLSVVKMTGA